MKASKYNEMLLDLNLFKEFVNNDEILVKLWERITSVEERFRRAQTILMNNKCSQKER